MPGSYKAALHNALFSFQMIEEALKICVGLSYEVIAKSAPAPIVFRFDPMSINDAPLGKLITMFSAINSNTELISDIKKVLKWRNFCAHNAFAHDFLNRASKSPFTAHDAEDVRVIVQFSSALVKRLGIEINATRELHRAVIGNSHD